jgi:hypothetical protein
MLDLRTLLETFDVSRAAAVASVFRKNHTWLCPTRVTGLALAGDPRLTQSPNLQYVGRKQRASWAKCAGDRDRRWNPCTQIGHRRRMTSVAALAQSASRLPWAGESEINSIVTVGVRASPRKHRRRGQGRANARRRRGPSLFAVVERRGTLP